MMVWVGTHEGSVLEQAVPTPCISWHTYCEEGQSESFLHSVTGFGKVAGTGGTAGVGGWIGFGEEGVTGAGDGTGGVIATGVVVDSGWTLETAHPAKNEIAIKIIAMDFALFIFLFLKIEFIAIISLEFFICSPS